MEKIKPTAAEIWLIKCISEKTIADFRYYPEDSADKKVRGTIIRNLLLGIPIDGFEAQAQPSGVTIRHTTIISPIILAEAIGNHGDDACPPLRVENCQFESQPSNEESTPYEEPDIDLRNSRIAALSLRDSRISNMALEGSRIYGNLDFRGLQSNKPEGSCTIKAESTIIIGSIFGEGAQLRLPPSLKRHQDTPDFSLQMSGAIVHGSVLLRAGFKAYGGVRLPTKICGDLWMDGSEIVAVSCSVALWGERSEISGSVILRPCLTDSGFFIFDCTGQINFNGLIINGSLDLCGARINPSNNHPTKPQDALLRCHLLTVKKSITACEFNSEDGSETQLTIAGDISLTSATVGGEIIISIMPSKTGTTISADYLTAGSNLVINKLRQDISLRGLKTKNEVSITGDTGNISNVNLTYAKIGSALYIDGEINKIEMFSIAAQSILIQDSSRVSTIIANEATTANGMFIKANKYPCEAPAAVEPWRLNHPTTGQE